jgi:hypothetical protein
MTQQPRPARNTLVILAALATFSSGITHAGEPDTLQSLAPPVYEEEGGWDIQFRPYLWTANLDGTSAVNGIKSDVDVDFEDLFDALDFTWASTQEIRRKGSKWTFFLDTFYVKLGPDTSDPIDDLTIKQAIIDGWIGYRVLESERGWIDLSAGVRWNYLSLDIDTVAGVGADGSEDWIDPHVGFRFRYSFSECVYMFGIADVGGFDVGSDMTYQLGLGAGYNVNKTFALEAGVRYLSVDYSDGGFLYDVDTTGIFLGAAFNF